MDHPLVSETNHTKKYPITKSSQDSTFQIQIQTAYSAVPLFNTNWACSIQNDPLTFLLTFHLHLHVNLLKLDP